jgi:beta-lactamase regulating signal transducer with metallopeptidase domain
MLCRDIELACDEKVIRAMGEEAKKPYSDALISASSPRRLISACPLAFGEVGVKKRIKAVLSYKKPTLWIIIAAVLALCIVAACFLAVFIVLFGIVPPTCL